VDAQTRQELASLGYVSAGTPREIQLGTDAPDPKDRVEVLKILSEVEQRLNAKQYPAAAHLMQRGLALDPANPMGHLSLALAYERMGEYARAVAVYQDAINKKVGADEVYSRLGKDELRLHQLDRAIEAMTRANQINPTDLDNLRNLGTAELELHRVDDAERAFKAITLQNDRYAAGWNGLGLVAIQRGDAPAALQDFERAIAVGPDEVEPLLNLGVLYQKTGNKEQALHYLALFLEKAPRDQYGKMFPDVRAAIRELRGGA
jgi:tetratricopeptide (TPR) repeat protein